MSATYGKDFDPTTLADSALEATALPGAEWLHQQLDAMYESKRHLEIALQQIRARLQATEAERDRMKGAGQQLVARMKQERALIQKANAERDDALRRAMEIANEREKLRGECRQWESRARAEREARSKIEKELEQFNRAVVARSSGVT